MASATEKETHLCENCKKNIPVANFTIHEIHCKRNIDVCTVCREPFPRSEMEEHIETEHAQVACKCNMKMEKRHLEKHKVSECPLRPAQCQYCELELSHSKVSDHEDYCGTRTESCSSCGRNVMMKDLLMHPEVCGKVPENKKINSERLFSHYSHRNDGETWFESQAMQNYLCKDPIRPVPRIPRQAQSRFYRNVTRTFDGNGRRPAQTMQVDPNLVDEQENLERNLIAGYSLPGGESSNLDYLLALSLQHEAPPSNHADPVDHIDRWKDFYSKDRSPSKSLSGRGTADLFSRNLSIPLNNSTDPKSNDTMLPCEFCEELFPEQDLILHQSGCNPGSVLSSFNQRSTSPVQQLEFDGQLGSFPDQTAYPLNNRFALLSDQLPVQAEENVIIPCEFCGIQLEEVYLFQHQDQCDQRPCTAGSTARSWTTAALLPKKDNLEKKESPQLHQRQMRHQGDYTHSILNDPEMMLSSEFEAARRPRKPSNIAGAREPLNSQIVVNRNHAERRVTINNMAKPAIIQTAAARPNRNHQHENAAQDFSGTSPPRPSPSWEEYSRLPMTQNNPVNLNRTTKIKNQKPGAGDVEKEE